MHSKKVFNLLKHSYGNGFTLAEVLITLGIIGVVAAMTMPSLIANYQNKELLTRVKKTYSTFYNAVNLALAETGSSEITSVFDTSNTSLQTTQNMQKYFNGAILCTKTGDSCPYYGIKAQNGKYNKVTGEAQYSEHMSVPYLKLVDGSIINFHQFSSCKTDRTAKRCKTDSSGNVVSNSSGTDCEYEEYTWTDVRCAYVVIDTNGIRKPNQYGADVYQIGIYEDGRLKEVSGYGSLNTILSNDKIDYTKYDVKD